MIISNLFLVAAPIHMKYEINIKNSENAAENNDVYL